MLIPKDPNTQSAPSFWNKDLKRKNEFIDDHQKSKKSILKKHVERNIVHKSKQDSCKKIDQLDKQNSKYKVSIVIDPNSSGSSQNIISEGSNKKKPIFLIPESQGSLHQAYQRNRSRKSSYQSNGSNKSSVKNYHFNYKQSKIDIFYSNSDISDEIWQDIQKEVDQNVPQKQPQLHKLQSSDVVEIKSPGQKGYEIVPKINFKLIEKYQLSNSDRIMEESDQRNSQSSKIFTDQQTQASRNYQRSFLRKDFRSPSYYQGFQEEEEDDDESASNYTIIQSPPVLKKKISSTKQNIANSTLKINNNHSESVIKNSRNGLRVSSMKKKSIYQQKLQQSRLRLKQVLDESIYKHPEQIGLTMNFTDSNVISRTSYISRTDKLSEFRQQIFQKINLYRFLNRVQYKVSKFFNFQSNEDILQELLSEIIRKKCYLLLNTEIELESLTKSQRKYDQEDQAIFSQIIKKYIEKESQQFYWKQVKEQFEKVSFLCFSIQDTILEFLSMTLPQIENSLENITGQVTRGLQTEKSMVLQLRVKMLKYLFYDLCKLNLTEHSRVSNIRESAFNKRQRLRRIIQENEWNQKIPLKQLSQDFYTLKSDFQHFDSCNI